jgi:large subunit ribosomal protein L5
LNGKPRNLSSARPSSSVVAVVTTATNDDEGRALLKQLGFPFKEN